MRVGKIEAGMPEDRFGDPPDVQLHVRVKHRHGLRMSAAVETMFRLPYVRAQVADEAVEHFGGVACMGGVNFIPQVPGEYGSASAPAAANEVESRLDRTPRFGAGQQ